jgi:hypothetical protein
MICGTCHGERGWWLLARLDWTEHPIGSRCKPTVRWEPCPSCLGSGVASCCEGAVGGPGDVTNQGGNPL